MILSFYSATLKSTVSISGLSTPLLSSCRDFLFPFVTFILLRSLNFVFAFSKMMRCETVHLD